MPWFDTVTDLVEGADVLRRRRYGVIEVVAGRFRRVRLRPFPKIISAPEILLFGGLHHSRRPGDRLLLYYNQPLRFPNFLALKYVVSARHTRMATLTRAADALDEIARLKQVDAILCDVGNWRISTRLLCRWGWHPHCPSRWHRHYIKRFYGRYPPPARWIAAAKDGHRRREATDRQASNAAAKQYDARLNALLWTPEEYVFDVDGKET
ncbi:MAG: hypothetical protein HQ567_19655 [Candidatus Nealsonbacteria bacterium]|nr:hypothetical protein [Candidatus Nealsonbacteria bacterium]